MLFPSPPSETLQQSLTERGLNKNLINNFIESLSQEANRPFNVDRPPYGGKNLSLDEISDALDPKTQYPPPHPQDILENKKVLLNNIANQTDKTSSSDTSSFNNKMENKMVLENLDRVLE